MHSIYIYQQYHSIYVTRQIQKRVIMKRLNFLKRTKRNKQKPRGKRELELLHSSSSPRPRRRMSTILQIIRGDEHPNSTLSPFIIINHPSSSESFTEHQKYGDKYISIYEVPHYATTTSSYPLQRRIDSNSSNLTLPKYPRWNRKGLKLYSASNSLDNTSPIITSVVSKSMSHDEDKYYHDSTLLDGEEDVAFLTFSDSYHDTTDSHELDYSSRETPTSISSNSSTYSNYSSTDTNDLEVCDALNVVMRYFCTSSLPKEKQSVSLQQNYPSLDQGDDDNVVVDNDDECPVDHRDDGFKGGKCTNDHGQVHHQDVTDTHEDETDRQDRQDELESQESKDGLEKQDRQDEQERQDSDDETKEATEEIVTTLPKLESKRQIKSKQKHFRMNLLKRMRLKTI